MSSRILGIFLLVLLSALGCSNSSREQQEIRGVLATRAAALNSRNVSQYVSVLSTSYKDKGKDFVQLFKSIETNFNDYTHIRYEAGEPSITVAGTGAESVGSYRMKVVVRGKDLTLNGTEHLRLAKEPGGWKITAGI